MKDNTEFRRYELKYTVSEMTAAKIRDYIHNICVQDPNTPVGQKGYVVNNLYFDTPDMRFYTDTKFRKMTRYKPRVRFYGDQVDEFIWPEIKYRHDSIIWKRRQPLRSEKWPELFAVQPSENRYPQIKSGIDSFKEMIYWHNASPTVHVRYFREAYVSTLEEYGRITFDRRLSYCPLYGSIDLRQREQEMIYYDDPVTTVSNCSYLIMEIKVETLMPYWVVNMIKQFQLEQRPFSKYCYSIDHMLGNTPSERNFPRSHFHISGSARQKHQRFKENI